MNDEKKRAMPRVMMVKPECSSSHLSDAEEAIDLSRAHHAGRDLSVSEVSRTDQVVVQRASLSLGQSDGLTQGSHCAVPVLEPVAPQFL